MTVSQISPFVNHCRDYLMREIFIPNMPNKVKSRDKSHDEKEKLEKPAKEEREKAEKEEALEKDAASFGWGTRRRRNIKNPSTTRSPERLETEIPIRLRCCRKITTSKIF